jgi:hypothetical protein
VFNESTDIDIASSIGEASRMVVVDEELARVAELPVIIESYVPERLQLWATRDVANKKAELADEERERERQARHTVERERQRLSDKSVLVVGITSQLLMGLSEYYIDSTDWNLQSKWCKWLGQGVIAFGGVTTMGFLGPCISYDDLLCGWGSMLSEFMGEWCPSGEWCHTGG